MMAEHAGKMALVGKAAKHRDRGDSLVRFRRLRHRFSRNGGEQNPRGSKGQETIAASKLGHGLPFDRRAHQKARLGSTIHWAKGDTPTSSTGMIGIWSR